MCTCLQQVLYIISGAYNPHGFQSWWMGTIRSHSFSQLWSNLLSLGLLACVWCLQQYYIVSWAYYNPNGFQSWWMGTLRSHSLSQLWFNVIFGLLACVHVCSKYFISCQGHITHMVFNHGGCEQSEAIHSHSCGLICYLWVCWHVCGVCNSII